MTHADLISVDGTACQVVSRVWLDGRLTGLSVRRGDQVEELDPDEFRHARKICIPKTDLFRLVLWPSPRGS